MSVSAGWSDSVSVSQAGEPQALPFVTHKLVLFEAESREALEQTLTSADYGRFSGGRASSYVALLKRTL